MCCGVNKGVSTCIGIWGGRLLLHGGWMDFYHIMVCTPLGYYGSTGCSQDKFSYYLILGFSNLVFI